MASEHCTQDQQNYQILLILTDGTISRGCVFVCAAHAGPAGVLDDLQAAVDEIVRGNDLPVSIIIVGIGAADFEKMDVLVSRLAVLFGISHFCVKDADDAPLRSTWGELARRDIVQFVPFREFKDKVRVRGLRVARMLYFLLTHVFQGLAVLAKEVLEEVPGQLLSYMKSRNIVPNPPRPGTPSATLSVLLWRVLTARRSATAAAAHRVQCVRDAVSGEPICGRFLHWT